jgi:hypothetical protein
LRFAPRGAVGRAALNFDEANNYGVVPRFAIMTIAAAFNYRETSRRYH